MQTILFQGDSITDAGRSRENDINMGLGYPTLIKGELGYDNPGRYTFYNRGISGNRIIDLYARIKIDFINLKPDYLSILIGVNDVWHEFSMKNGVSAEKYFKIYSMLIEEIKEVLPDTKIMILEPFVLKCSGTEEHFDEFRAEVQKRAAKAKEIAGTYNLSFIALQDKFDEAAKTAPVEFWLSDGIHPTTIGHELIKRSWIEEFKKLRK